MHLGTSNRTLFYPIAQNRHKSEFRKNILSFRNNDIYPSRSPNLKLLDFSVWSILERRSWALLILRSILLRQNFARNGLWWRIRNNFHFMSDRIWTGDVSAGLCHMIVYRHHKILLHRSWKFTYRIYHSVYLSNKVGISSCHHCNSRRDYRERCEKKKKKRNEDTLLNDSKK